MHESFLGCKKMMRMQPRPIISMSLKDNGRRMRMGRSLVSREAFASLL